MHFLRIIPLLAISLSGLLCACSNDSSGDTKSNDQETTTDIPANDSNINDSARLALIEKLIETEQYNTALHHANQLLKKNPDNPAFLFIKADMLERMSDTINAIAFYKKASAEAGNFLQADMKLLNLYTESRHPETIKLTDSLLTRTDTEKYQSDILLMKGIYYTKKGLLKQAENIFSFIITNNYSYLDAYIEKGLLYYDQQRYTE
ncbi:MAG: tetratricopeptide repeat protein, partial [Bacteroidota bacterium]